MKVALTALLLSLSFQTLARDVSISDDCKECHQALRGMPGNSSLDEIAKITANPEMEKFGNSLCISMVNANVTGKDIVKTLQDQILQKLKITRSTPNYQDKIIAFWNRNKNYFVCKGKINSITRDQEHITKRALALGIEKHVFYKFLLNNPNTDVNAIEWHNGEAETVLDYIDKILSDPNAKDKYVIKDIKELREMLIDYFDAKKAEDIV